MAITLLQLRYLVSVADHGSITAAAQSLGVSQPVLSRSLAALQKEVDAPLLRPQGRKIVLTSEGAAVIALAKRSVSAADDFKRIVHEKQAPRLLRLACGSGLATLLSDAINQTLHAWPDLSINILRADEDDSCRRLLASGQADLALCERHITPDGFSWAFVSRLEAVLVSPQTLDLPDNVRLADLADVPMMVPPSTPFRQHKFDDWFLRAGVRSNLVLEVEDMSLLLPMAAAGVASFIGWRSVCEGEQRVKLRGLLPPPTTDIGLCYPLDRNKNVSDFVATCLASKKVSHSCIGG